jgi:hypothetical protein
VLCRSSGMMWRSVGGGNVDEGLCLALSRVMPVGPPKARCLCVGGCVEEEKGGLPLSFWRARCSKVS